MHPYLRIHQGSHQQRDPAKKLRKEMCGYEENTDQRWPQEGGRSKEGHGKTSLLGIEHARLKLSAVMQR